MSKEAIHLFHLLGFPHGAAIFPLSGKVVAEHTADVMLPHRHDHYTCFFIETGVMHFKIDFQEVVVGPSSFLLSCPGQVHQFVSGSDLKGWVIAFDARFPDEQARTIIEQSFAKAVLLALSPAQKKGFAHLAHLLNAVLREDTPTGFQQQELHHLVNALFYKATAIFQEQEDQRVSTYSSRSIVIAKTFHQLVKTHFHTLKKPAAYAAKMHITVSYLNDTVKSVTGFSATYFIQQEVMREAQRLLCYTDNSIKAIAADLGYEDDKYFTRLFSKTTGSSPATFRKLVLRSAGAKKEL